MFNYDLIVIGSGSAGFTAALEARRLGYKVLIVEKDKVGGECANTGCIPSKSLIKAAKIVHEIRQSEKYGLPEHKPDAIDLENVMEHVRSVVLEVRRREQEACKRQNIDLLFGTASFIDQKTIQAQNRRISSRFFLISTGSSPAVPEIEGLSETGFLTNRTLFDLRQLPETLLVIGGGPIAVETAQAFRRLGSEVILLQRADRILPRDDEELVARLTGILKEEGIKIYTNVSVERAARFNDRKQLTIRTGREFSTVEGDEILAAAGRIPNLSGLNLERIGVRIEKRGIAVNGHFQTSVKNIYACGDCIGGYLFTHIAGYQAKIAVYHALAALPVGANYRVAPWATFTDPELAHVGLTEKEAAGSNGRAISIERFPFRDIDRAVTDRETDGLIKVIAGKNGKILGAHILGARAGELLHEFVLAMEHGLTLDKIASTIHVYPTFSLGVWQSTEKRFQESLNDSILIKLFRLFAPKSGAVTPPNS